MTLTRRAYLEKDAKALQAWGYSTKIGETASSHFGAEDDIADLSCVSDGILASFPEADMVPTEQFWTAVSPEHETIELTNVFRTPMLSRLLDLEIDAVVAAYHQSFDVGFGFTEIVISGFYTDIDRDIAGIVALGVQEKNVVHVSQADLEYGETFGHLGPYPLFGAAMPSADVCHVVSERAGAALKEMADKSPFRTIIVAARDNPYSAAKNAEDEKWAAIRDKEAEFRKNLDQAECGKAHAQYLAAEAYRQGRGVAKDQLRAHFWHLLATKTGKESSAYWVKNSAYRVVQLSDQMSAEQIAESERLASNWEPDPAQCEPKKAPTLRALSFSIETKLRRAECGDMDAQLDVGRRYKYGASLPKDLVQAHLWFELAEQRGHRLADQYLKGTQAQMSPEQIAEAKRLVAEWKPDPARCATEAVLPSY